MPDERRDDLESRWRRRFRQYAGLFDDDARIAGWTQGGLEARYRYFHRLWPHSMHAPDMAVRWLDIGCGAGTYSRFLESHGIEVMALDYSIESLIKARLRSDGSIHWVNADARRLPVCKGGIDGVLCFGVFQTLSEPDTLLLQIRSSLRHGGEVWVDALNSFCIPNLLDVLRRKLRNEPLHLRYDNPWRLKKMLSSNGFSGIRLHWVPILPGSLRSMTWLVESTPFRSLLRWVPGLGPLLCHSLLVTATRDKSRD